MYDALNMAVRAPGLLPDEPPKEFKCTYYHLKNAVTHLAGVDDTSTPFWRGQDKFWDVPAESDKEDGHSYHKGSTVTWTSFISISADRSTAEHFSGKSGVLFKLVDMQPNFGANLAALSIFPNEKEILLPPGSSFQVMERSEAAGGRQVVVMKHVGLWAEPQHAELKRQDLELQAALDDRSIPCYSQQPCSRLPYAK